MRLTGLDFHEENRKAFRFVLSRCQTSRSVYTSAPQIERSSELFVLDAFSPLHHTTLHIHILHGKGLEDIINRTKAIFSFCIQSYER